MTRVIPAVAIGLGLLCADLSAQGRNFAGTWTMDLERTLAANPVVSGGGGGRGGRSAGGGGVAVIPVVPPGAGMRSGGGGRGGARSGGGGGAMTIALDANTFSIGSGETTTTYRLDGSPSTTESPRGQLTINASWQGDRVVIQTTSPAETGAIVTTVAWYIDGESLVRETSAPGPDGQAVTRKTYYKRSL